MTYEESYKVVKATLQELAKRNGNVIDLSNINLEEMGKHIVENLESRDIENYSAAGGDLGPLGPVIFFGGLTYIVGFCGYILIKYITHKIRIMFDS